MSEVSCPSCERSGFSSVTGMKIHHKQSHGESIAGKEVECSYCSSTLRRKPAHIERNEHFFCSDDDCYERWQSENVVGENHHQYDSQEIRCSECGDTFTKRDCEINDERNFCSHECYHQWMTDNLTGEDHPSWEGGKEAVECSSCGDTLHRKRYYIDKNEHFFCDYQCHGDWRSENMRGNNHPRWKGGQDLYHLLRSHISERCWTMMYQEYQKKFNTCEMCGSEKNIHMHHIIPIMAGGTNDEWNIMPLCSSCHPKVERYTDNFTNAIYEISQEDD